MKFYSMVFTQATRILYPFSKRGYTKWGKGDAKERRRRTKERRKERKESREKSSEREESRNGREWKIESAFYLTSFCFIFEFLLIADIYWPIGSCAQINHNF